ncbi:MAG TPA: immunoglobulin domain-containing protein [Verrucomicrobiae bacterium]|jgi:hypothetical protein
MSGQAPFTYQWMSNGVPITPWEPVTGNRFTLNNVISAYDAQYSVEVTNTDGIAISSNATLTVIVPPTITTQPVSLTNNAGTTAIFSVTNSGSPSTYQWYYNGTNLLVDGGYISGSATPMLTVSNVLGANDGAYSVTISNAAAVAVSSNAMLTVIDPIITSQPVSVTNNLGSPASFTVAAYGTAPQYQWTQNGSIIPGATTATYSLASVVDTNAGNYSAIVYNDFGSVTSSVVTLTIIDPPVITSEPLSLTVNAMSNATFAVGYTGTSPSIQWFKDGSPLNNGGNVSGATTVNLVLSNVRDRDAANYTVVLSNAAGTVTSTPPAVLTVIDPPIITQSPVSITNNAGTTATFTVTTSGSTPNYQWLFNGTNALANGTNISGATTATLTISNVFGTNAGFYSVVVSNAAGTQTSASAALVVVDPIITVQPVGVTNFDGTTANFSVTAVGTAPLSYQWYVDGYILDGSTNSILTLPDIENSDEGEYTVVITNYYGSVTSAPATLLTVLPLVVSEPFSVTVLVGQSASFSVGVNGETPFNYQWQKNGTNISGATSPILSFASVQTTDAGAYDVIVQNPVGTEISSSATLAVYTSVVSTNSIRAAHSGVTISVGGVPGYVYVIQESPDLMTWIPVQTNYSPFTFTDTNIGQVPAQYYRSVYQP